MASVDELVRPYGTVRQARGTVPPIDQCILILHGEREKGKRAFLHRSDLYIYGQRMLKAEFIDVLTPEDQLYVKVSFRPQGRRAPRGKHAIDFEVVKAWLGKAPNDKKEDVASADGDQEKKEFLDFLKKHKLTEDTFRDCYEGKRPTKPFFPIKTPRLLNTCFVSSLLTPPGEGEGATCGVLEVADGPLSKMLWGFDQLCLYICGVKIDCNDLNRLFLAADKGYQK